jgi:GntR family transcriptional regulator, phosphonate transport system regulatory protein
MSDERVDTDAPERPTARWARIAAVLREEILDGRIAAGERLPNEQALADRFGVNRHTLRQAMQALAHEGHVHVVHGSGTFVRFFNA